MTGRRLRRHGPFGILAVTLLLLPASCTPTDPARELVAESIRAHGGDRFEAAEIRFAFRSAHFRVVREGDRYLYERSYVDTLGATVVERMTNTETYREVEGERIALDMDEVAQVETNVHSVVYFSLLPYRLLDPAVRIRELESVEVEGQPYRKVEVTFQEEGGGVDWEDRFVHWFHRDAHTLDYLAYRYHRDGGGTRFRRAVNRRTVAGLVLQDYETFTSIEEIGDIADYDTYLKAGRLRFVSMVEIDDVTVGPPPPLVTN